MDHYREAERLLAQAVEVPADGAAMLVARAQVHATLALAAISAAASEERAADFDDPRGV